MKQNDEIRPFVRRRGANETRRLPGGNPFGFSWLVTTFISLGAFIGAPAVAQNAPAAAAISSEPTRIETFEYTVREGDTCSGIARQFFENGRRYDIIHSFNPTMGPPPHDLLAGTVLVLPRSVVPAGYGPDARVTGMVRDVDAQEPRAEAWRRAELGEELYRAWRVNTRPRSAATLTFRDTSVVEMRSDTIVIILGQSDRPVRPENDTAELATGALRSRLGELASGLSLRVATPSSQTELQGGSAVVAVDGEGTTRLSNHVGGVAVLRGRVGGRARVRPGWGSKVRRGERPTPPRELPPSPALSAEVGRFLALPGRGATVSGSWAPVEGATRYRIEIARRPDGRDLVESVEVPAEATRFDVVGLPAGDYYVRVAAFDDDHFESAPSEPLAIRVEEASLESPDGRSVSVSPETEGDLALGLGWRLSVPPGVLCTDGGGEPQNPLLVSQSGAIEIRCAGGDGPGIGPLDATVPTPSIERTVDATGTSLVRGTSVRVQLAVQGIAPSSLELRGSRGITIHRVDTISDERVDVWLDIGEDALENSSLTVFLAAGQTTLSDVHFSVVDAQPTVAAGDREESAAPSEEGSGIRLPSSTETFGLAPLAPVLSLRDSDSLRSSVGLAGLVTFPREDEADIRARLVADARAVFVEGYLVVGAGAILDPTETWLRDEDRGSGTFFAELASIFWRSDDLSLTGGARAWFPAGQTGALPSTRLQPSFELAWRPEVRFNLRTRQGAILDVDERGARMWASAYGADARLIGPLHLGVEADLVYGTSLDDGEILAGAAALSLLLDFRVAQIGLASRRSVGDSSDRLLGPGSVAASFRLIFP